MPGDLRPAAGSPGARPAVCSDLDVLEEAISSQMPGLPTLERELPCRAQRSCAVTAPCGCARHPSNRRDPSSRIFRSRPGTRGKASIDILGRRGGLQLAGCGTSVKHGGTDGQALFRGLLAQFATA